MACKELTDEERPVIVSLAWGIERFRCCANPSTQQIIENKFGSLEYNDYL